MKIKTDLDLALLCFGEHTEHESSEQLLTLLADADLHDFLGGGGDLGLLGGGVLLPLIGERLDGGVLRPPPGDDRRGGGERGDRRPPGLERRGGGERGERRLTGERERLWCRLGDGDEEPSMYRDL